MKYCISGFCQKIQSESVGERNCTCIIHVVFIPSIVLLVVCRTAGGPGIILYQKSHAKLCNYIIQCKKVTLKHQLFLATYELQAFILCLFGVYIDCALTLCKSLKPYLSSTVDGSTLNVADLLTAHAR